MTCHDDTVYSEVKDLMADGETRTWREVVDEVCPVGDGSPITVESLSVAEALSRMCEDGTLDHLDGKTVSYRLHVRPEPYSLVLALACLKRDAESYSVEALCEDEATSYARAFVHLCRAMDCVRSGMLFRDAAEGRERP